jgi:hypothetical protein
MIKSVSFISARFHRTIIRQDVSTIFSRSLSVRTRSES